MNSQPYKYVYVKTRQLLSPIAAQNKCHIITRKEHVIRTDDLGGAAGEWGRFCSDCQLSAFPIGQLRQ